MVTATGIAMALIIATLILTVPLIIGEEQPESDVFPPPDSVYASAS